MEAAYTRLSQAVSANASMPKEEQLCALARGAAGLFEDVEATHVPVLAHDVLDAAAVAARQLYVLLSPGVCAWLRSGFVSVPWTSHSSSG
jgi:hypothetical protein